MAVAAGGAVTYAGARVKTKRGYGAGVEAWNALVDAEDPSAVDKEAFSTIRERFGQSPEVVDGIKKAYFSYLMVRLVRPYTARAHQTCADKSCASAMRHL